jgi:hypothetical protein
MRIYMAVIALCVGSSGAAAQTTGSRLPDVPAITTSRAATDSFAQLIAPAIAQARATYPEARRRFLAGLPRGHSFAVTTRISDPEGRTEQIFVTVDSIANGKIDGRIASEIALVRSYQAGQRYALSEADVLDWTILDPRGNEEGNFVGKLVDEYHARRRAASVGTVPFRFATENQEFALVGDFAGEVRVTRDSLEVMVRSGTATAHRDVELLTDVTLRAALAFRASEDGGWALAAMSDSIPVRRALSTGERAPLPSARFVLPRPPVALADYWLVFRFEAVARTTGQPPKEFAAYAPGNPAMFLGYK